ncbi:MAG TPA: hypothetical protein V6C81_32460 [Planktothrix sp.]
MTDGCPISTAEAKQDAARLSGLLKAGDPEFKLEFAQYGAGGSKNCASDAFIRELARLDPEDVNITGNKVTIDPWCIVCTEVLDELKHKKSIGDVTQELSQNVLPQDHARFMNEFNTRAKAQQVHLRVAENSSTHKLELQVDSI